MTGGTIEVDGSVGDWAGAEMRGGLLKVRGNAGGFLGAAYPGSRPGMRDGVILVEGAVGDDVGLAMRRGLIAIGGNVGGRAGPRHDRRLDLRVRARGSICRRGDETGDFGILRAVRSVRTGLLPTFVPSGPPGGPTSSNLYLRQLAATGVPCAGGHFHRDTEPLQWRPGRKRTGRSPGLVLIPADVRRGHDES